MQRKTIERVLKSKFGKWLDSIQDEELKKLLKENTIVTGGCIASMLLQEKINDFDVYFTNKETALSVATHYVNIFNRLNNENVAVVVQETLSTPYNRIKIIVPSTGIAKEKAQTRNDKLKYRPIILSSNAITLSGKVQLVVRFYGDADEIHSNYDFVHCTNYWTSSDGKLVLRTEAMEALLSRALRYQGSKYPLCSIIRTRKFVKRGWRINGGQYLKMCFQLSQLDLTDIAVLEDQLIGVDTAYFSQLINALRKQREKNPDFEIDEEYVVDLIDKIFG